MKSAIVLSCEYDKPLNFPNGDVIHYHRLQLSNGDSGICAIREVLPAKLAEGATILYTLDIERIQLRWSATVLSCEYDKPLNFPNGDVIHYHRLQLSNGDSGNCGVSEAFPPKIADGATILYTIENGSIKLLQQTD